MAGLPSHNLSMLLVTMSENENLASVGLYRYQEHESHHYFNIQEKLAGD